MQQEQSKQKKILGTLSLAGAIRELAGTTGESVALKNIPAGMLQLSILSLLQTKSVTVLLPSVKAVREWQRQFELLSESVHYSFGVHAVLQTIFWGHERLARRDQDIKSRVKAVADLQRKKNSLFLATAPGLLQKTFEPKTFAKASLALQKGASLEQGSFLSWLSKHGYHEHEDLPDEASFCKRGSVVDVFDPHLKNIVRVEFFGDEIESIRIASPESLRTIESNEKHQFFPANELFYGEDSKQWAQKLQDHFHRQNVPPSISNGVVESFLDQTPFLGNHVAIPLLVGDSNCFLSFMGDCIFVAPESVDACVDQFKENLDNEEVAWSANNDDQKDLFHLRPEVTFSEIKMLQDLFWFEAKSASYSPEDAAITFSQNDAAESARERLQSLTIEPKTKEAWSAHIGARLEKNGRVLLLESKEHSLSSEFVRSIHREGTASVTASRAPLHSFLAGTPQDFEVARCHGDLDHFFYDIESETEFIPARSILGKDKLQPKKHSKKLQNYLSSFEKLSAGELVVHIKHGICRYEGIVELEVNSLKSDFLLLCFHGEDKMYLPVDRLGLLQKFGSDQSAKLDKLGGDRWTQRKEKVQKEIEDIAQKLIEAHAQRQSTRENPFEPKSAYSEKVSRSFPYIETPDQLRCIEEIEVDLNSSKLMDRLICGDVGFGKTEVAIRAAVRAIEQGMQVMVLVPTTVLSFQHYKTFCTRLEGTGIRVGRLNRFVKGKEVKQTLEQLELGEIDILIGTHRLFSKDVRWNRLGLLVVDEEQRFGVTHKEILKGYRKRTDVLTLSATPIPRTLQMSILGLRDISLLQTPPVDRRPIKTYISSFDESLVSAAIDRELSRRGQVFFLHNRVQDIEEMKSMLEKISPKAKIRIAHGQQNENTLEKTLVDFIHHEFDVLLCTTIIESGIDIPNVNTILVNQAQKFGLSQLYQIRGRVGRDRAQAYAYLLTPDGYKLRGTARERLDVLSTYQELGAGFHIASHDLDIRGAGNILGSDQSGHAHSVGVEMYIKLLKDEIARQRDEVAEKQGLPVEMHLPVSYKIPQTYVASTNRRLALYKEFFDADDLDEVEALSKKTTDMFGSFPEQVRLLIELAKVRVALREIRVQTVRYKEPGICILKFYALDEKKLHKLIHIGKEKKSTFAVGPDMRLFINAKSQPGATVDSQTSFCTELLHSLRTLKKKLK